MSVEEKRVKVTYNGVKFICSCSFEDSDIPRAAHFWFDSALKRWTTGSIRCAARLMKYCDENAKRAIIDRLVPDATERSFNGRPRSSYRYNF